MACPPEVEETIRESDQWAETLRRIQLSVDINEVLPKEHTEKGFFEWIMTRNDILLELVNWLDWAKLNAKFVKDRKIARSMKEEGNEFFKKKNYSASLASYTESAKYASFENYDYSMAVANRSAALFYLDKYKECLQDIELAIMCGYPEKIFWKLYLRAAQCYIKLGQARLALDELEKLHNSLENNNEITVEAKDSILNRGNNLRKMAEEHLIAHGDSPILPGPNTIINPEDLIQKNDQFPFASNSMILRTSPTRGRYVVAGKPIRKGDILFVEKPFAWVPVTHGNDVLLCANCCEIMDDPIAPCRECLDTLYCSPKCWEDAWSDHHWECTGYHMGLWHQIGISHLAFKILLVSVTTCDSQWFNGVQKLLSNIEKKDLEDVFSVTIASLMVTTYLERFTNFFDVVDIKKCLVDKFDDPNLSFDVDVTTRDGKRLYIGSMLLRLSLQMFCNAYAVTKILESFDSSAHTLVVEEQQRIATGVYPSSSMLNHSCDPTIIQTFWKNWLIVKAVKNVEKGQEIFNCYGPYFRRMEKAQRRISLSKQYCFFCECDACTNPALDFFKQRFDGFKCLKCSGPSLRVPNANTHRCLDCESTSEITFSDALNEAATLCSDGMKLTNDELWEQAIPYFEKCLAIRTKYLYKYNVEIAITNDALGQCYASTCHWLAAIGYLEKSLAAMEQKYGADSIEVANELNKTTDVCFQYIQRELNRRGTEEFRDIVIRTQRYVDRAFGIVSITSGPWNEKYQEINEKKRQLSAYLEQLRP